MLGRRGNRGLATLKEQGNEQLFWKSGWKWIHKIFVHIVCCVLCLVGQSCLTVQPHGLQVIRLLCPWMLQASILEWIAMHSAKGSSQPRDWTQVSHVTGGFCTVHQGSSLQIVEGCKLRRSFTVFSYYQMFL